MGRLAADGLNALPSPASGRAAPVRAATPRTARPAQPTRPPAPARPTPDPDGALRALLDDLTVDEAVALVEAGRYPPDRVLTVERANRNRKTLIEALTPDPTPDTEEQ